ncbi:MAG: Cys-Gln thioester bond-forming surface protein, partial [Christensenellaceae bacterium]|nr:Cys-Gln thioester bond-forming surface protein [Christensenellaceae bacterium]
GSSDSVKGDEVGTERPNEDGSASVVTEQGDVTVSTDKITVTETVDPELSDFDYVYGNAEATADNDLFNPYGGAVLPAEGEKHPVEDGYQHVLVGTGTSSQFYAGVLYKSPGYEGEQPVYVAEDGTAYYARRTDLGKYHKLEGLYHNGEMVEGGTDFVYKGVWSNVTHYIMIDAETGELITTYCADATTQTEDGFSYTFENVEDADYYSEEQAAMIRSIAKKGFWGTKDDPATSEKELGSLEAMRDMMRDAKDEDGNAIFTAKEIEDLTEGIAMSATQFAIWTFSNKMNDLAYVNAQYIQKDADNNAKGYHYTHLKNVPEDKLSSVDTIFKLYQYLINLAPTPIEKKTTSNTVLNADNFVGDMSLTVLGKAKDHANNKDDDKTNDAYNTKISFALVVAPSGNEEDDLVVSIVAPDGTVLAKGRIAGALKDGEIQLTKDANNNYTFENIVLTENQKTFKLNLAGIQNLEKGIYLYTSEVREGTSSQTMVGVAEGNRSVNVTMELEFSLDVNDEIVTTERVWSDAGDPVVIPNDPIILPGGGIEGGEEEDTLDENPVVPGDGEIIEPDLEIEEIEKINKVTIKKANTETILDEEVPLAAAPKTGDYTFVLIAVIAVLALGIAAAFVIDKKRKSAKH